MTGQPSCKQKEQIISFLCLIFLIGLLPICEACINSELHCSYKHAVDGLFRVYKEEGIQRLFSGATAATARAVLMTVGQISFYDQIKQILLGTGYFKDNIITHFTSSLAAVSYFPIDITFRDGRLATTAN